MTTLLETAFEKASSLREQDWIASYLLDEMSYKNSEQFLKDKEYLEGVVEDIDNGSATLLTHDEIWSKIEASK